MIYPAPVVGNATQSLDLPNLDPGLTDRHDVNLQHMKREEENGEMKDAEPNSIVCVRSPYNFMKLPSSKTNGHDELISGLKSVPLLSPLPLKEIEQFSKELTINGAKKNKKK